MFPEHHPCLATCAQSKQYLYRLKNAERLLLSQQSLDTWITKDKNQWSEVLPADWGLSWAPKSAWNCTFCHVSRFSQLPHGDSKVSVQSKNACYHSHYSRTHSSSLKTITFLESSTTDIRPISRRPFGRYLISHPTFCRNCPRTKRFVGAYTVCMN